MLVPDFPGKVYHNHPLIKLLGKETKHVQHLNHPDFIRSAGNVDEYQTSIEESMDQMNRFWHAPYTQVALSEDFYNSYLSERDNLLATAEGNSLQPMAVARFVLYISETSSTLVEVQVRNEGEIIGTECSTYSTAKQASGTQFYLSASYGFEILKSQVKRFGFDSRDFLLSEDSHESFRLWLDPMLMVTYILSGNYTDPTSLVVTKPRSGSSPLGRSDRKVLAGKVNHL